MKYLDETVSESVNIEIDGCFTFNVNVKNYVEYSYLFNFLGQIISLINIV